MAAVVTGRFFAWTEDCHRFGLRERPFYYAHDAGRFAGRPGLPERALVFGLNQAAVYEYHNSLPRRVAFDGRLELASRATFEAYVQLHQRLNTGDPRWRGGVRRLGDPLILVDHEDNVASEATLLADPSWRCIYQDAVAAIFLPRDRDRHLESAYPTVDFAARHFAHRRQRSPHSAPGSALAEGRGLARLSAVLGHRPASLWRLRIPVGLVALDCALAAVAETPSAAAPWVILGHAALALAMEPGDGQAATSPGAGWDPALGLPWAQATAAYRSALARDSRDEPARASLAATLALRGLTDAPRAPAPRGPALPWAVADRLAGHYLHLGRPEEARRTWLDAANPPAALREARLADAALAAWDLDAAAAGYRRALATDPDLADAWVGLALAALEDGQAGVALDAAHAVLRTAAPIEPRRRTLLEGIAALCADHAR
jgi:hypothetical protein